MGREGFEPTTRWLRVSCSTNWANVPKMNTCLSYTPTFKKSIAIFYFITRIIPLIIVGKNFYYRYFIYFQKIFLINYTFFSCYFSSLLYKKVNALFKYFWQNTNEIYTISTTILVLLLSRKKQFLTKNKSRFFEHFLVPFLLNLWLNGICWIISEQIFNWSYQQNIFRIFLCYRIIEQTAPLIFKHYRNTSYCVSFLLQTQYLVFWGWLYFLFRLIFFISTRQKFFLGGNDYER